jgi:hypothetical protein
MHVPLKPWNHAGDENECSGSYVAFVALIENF